MSMYLLSHFSHGERLWEDHRSSLAMCDIFLQPDIVAIDELAGDHETLRARVDELASMRGLFPDVQANMDEV